MLCISSPGTVTYTQSLQATVKGSYIRASLTVARSPMKSVLGLTYEVVTVIWYDGKFTSATAGQNMPKMKSC
jgi:hypothetical protein